MVSRVKTVSLQGVEALQVDVQVQISPGNVGFNIVGLPDKAVAESRERVRAALLASGLALPPKRITVNLAPADLPKEGSHFDLPIAIGIMAAMGALPALELSNYVVMGELALDGNIMPVAGILPAAIAANAMDRSLICPEACGPEAAWSGKDMIILAPRSLLQLANHFRGYQSLERPEPKPAAKEALGADLSDVRGQECAKRALEIAAAGGHHMLLCGPPGAGKSMLASRLPSILPALTPRELLEVSTIASVAGQIGSGGISNKRPFRSPHHSASMAALVGGGFRAKPGEVSLSHHGVLFLDELPEFNPAVLDSLRQPIETGQTMIARANYRVSYPSEFQLIAAMNPCRCGFAGTPGHLCRQGARCADDYQARLSGPLLDRIDLRIDVPAVTAAELVADLGRPAQNSETSKTVAARVEAARRVQARRYGEIGGKAMINAKVDTKILTDLSPPTTEAIHLLSDAADQLQLTARGYHRVLRVARTIADLDQEPQIARPHVAEALSYRGSFGLKMAA